MRATLALIIVSMILIFGGAAVILGLYLFGVLGN